MTYFFNISIYVDIFIIVFYLPYYCNIRYVVLSFDEVKTHYYYYYLDVCFVAVPDKKDIWLPSPEMFYNTDRDMWRQVTMAAKFLVLNNLSWRRQPFLL